MPSGILFSLAVLLPPSLSSMIVSLVYLDAADIILLFYLKVFLVGILLGYLLLSSWALFVMSVSTILAFRSALAAILTGTSSTTASSESNSVPVVTGA